MKKPSRRGMLNDALAVTGAGRVGGPAQHRASRAGAAAAPRHGATRWWAVGTAIGTLLLAGACSQRADPQVATAAPAGDAAAATTPAVTGVQAELADYLKAQATWVACMKKEGIDLPDPDAKGRVDTAKVESSDKYGKASDACAALYRKPSQTVTELQEPPLTPAQIAAEKKLAVCIRENGVPQYRDPGENGRGGGLPDDVTPDPRTFDTAFQKCIKDPEFVAAYPNGEFAGG